MKEKIKSEILDYISRSDKTSFEVKNKLHKLCQKSKVPPEGVGPLVDELLSYLYDLALVNDDDYVKRYIEQFSSRKKMGRLKFFQKLRKKGIPDDLIKKYTYLFDTEAEKEALIHTAKRKYDTLIKRYPTNEAKKRLFSYLLGKGFSGDNLYSVFDTIDTLK